MSNLDMLLESQRDYFNQNETLNIDFRIKQLQKLKATIISYRKDIELVLYEDLTKVSENSPTSVSGEMNRFFHFITVFLLKIGIICYNIYATNIKRIEL